MKDGSSSSSSSSNSSSSNNNNHTDTSNKYQLIGVFRRRHPLDLWEIMRDPSTTTPPSSRTSSSSQQTVPANDDVTTRGAAAVVVLSVELSSFEVEAGRWEGLLACPTSLLTTDMKTTICHEASRESGADTDTAAGTAAASDPAVLTGTLEFFILPLTSPDGEQEGERAVPSLETRLLPRLLEGMPPLSSDEDGDGEENEESGAVLLRSVAVPIAFFAPPPLPPSPPPPLSAMSPSTPSPPSSLLLSMERGDRGGAVAHSTLLRSSLFGVVSIVLNTDIAFFFFRFFCMLCFFFGGGAGGKGVVVCDWSH
jgi:hypothetical protein